MTHLKRSGKCKLKSENHKLQIVGRRAGTRSWTRSLAKSTFHFSIFNFQFSLLLISSLLFLGATTSSVSAQQKNSCVECHARLDDPRISAPAKLFDNDIHKARGLMCNDCHGGDPKRDHTGSCSRRS
jgi:hypothetical protein